MDGFQYRRVVTRNAGITSDDISGFTLATISAVGFTFTWPKVAADALATDVTAELPLGRMPTAGRALAAYFIPSEGFNWNPFNYKRFFIYKRTAGGAQTLFGFHQTNQPATNAAFEPISIPIIPSGSNLLAGDVITMSIGIDGVGVILPAGRILVECALAPGLGQYTQT